jgi:hypothetical protein
MMLAVPRVAQCSVSNDLIEYHARSTIIANVAASDFVLPPPTAAEMLK